MSDEVLGRLADNPTLFPFECPGCKYGHVLDTAPGKWSWNGDFVKPTASPSLFVNQKGNPKYPKCHFFIKNGQLEFCGDTTHELAGQTVPMAPWEDE